DGPGVQRLAEYRHEVLARDPFRAAAGKHDRITGHHLFSAKTVTKDPQKAGDTPSSGACIRFQASSVANRVPKNGYSTAAIRKPPSRSRRISESSVKRLTCVGSWSKRKR